MTKTRIDHRQEIIKLIKQAGYTCGIYEVFNDFLELTACTISNTVDPSHWQEREDRYLKVINSYDKKHQQLFPQMFYHLVEALECKTQTTGPEDVLGVIYHELELHRKEKAQYFTPQHISDLMGMIALGDDDCQSDIENKGYISMCEPTCGSGVMVTSFCKAMQKVNLNYCTQLVVTAIDIDAKCAWMTYIQLALLGVAAVVIHGDSLTLHEHSRWYTPIYVMNGWIWRQRCGMTTARNRHDEMLKCALEPTYAALRHVDSLLRTTESDNAAEPTQAAILAVEDTSPTNQLQMSFDVDMGAVKASKPVREVRPTNQKPVPDKELEQMQISLFPDS